MLDFKAPWVPLEAGPNDAQFARYPEESIAEWHERHRLEAKPPKKTRRHHGAA